MDPRFAGGPLACDAHPVLTLPNEITSEIFIHFLPVYPICPSLHGLFSPIILTHICHQWREIALTTSALWRAISLDYRLQHHTWAGTHELLQLYITRSRAFPLSIEVFADDELPPEAEATLVSHRLRSEFLTLRWDGVDTFSTLFGRPMPVLRHLDLLFCHTPGPDPLFDSRDVSLLRSVALECGSDGVGLPWAQLTTLKLVCVPPNECTRVLQQTASLVHCELSLYLEIPDDNIHIQEPDITLPHLETFHFKVVDGHPFAPYMIECFILPALRSLEVEEELLGSDPIHTLRAFLSKSGCTLQELHIGDHNGELVTVNSYRRAFPSIPNFTSDWDSDEDNSDAGSTAISPAS
ncbi:hypothetical protein C8R43DRAFT_506101 [Mycena crocata]|nr:hypothetical protein C8R43DRAFT_506101 [Mycena crocata]